MYSFSPIQGTKSIFLLKFHGSRIWEFDIIISGTVLFSPYLYLRYIKLCVPKCESLQGDRGGDEEADDAGQGEGGGGGQGQDV